MEVPGFFPDLGEFLKARYGEHTVRIAGAFSLGSACRYLDEYCSMTGTTAWEGKCFCGTIDFAPKLWKDFCEAVQDTLYLNLDLRRSNGLTVQEIEPQLDFWLEIDVRPSTPTSSAQTGEAYVPCQAVSVGGVRLLPTEEEILKRHLWWQQESSRCLKRVGSEALAIGELLSPSLPVRPKLLLDKYYRNHLALLLVSRAMQGQRWESLLEEYLNLRWVSLQDVESVCESLKALQSRSDGGKHEGDLACLAANLSVWYLATKIYHRAPRGYLELEQMEVFGENAAGAALLLNEARYCISRLSAPCLPCDDLEDHIDSFFEHPGFRSVLTKRIGSFPRASLDHPELPHAISLYVKYDLLRQVHRSGGECSVTDEVADRCEKNITQIINWAKQLAQHEIRLFEPQH